MEIWSWLCELPNNSAEWSESNSLLLPLATANPRFLNKDESTRSIQLRAEKTTSPDSEQLVTLSVCSLTSDQLSTLWVSDTCHLSSKQPFLPVVLQLLQETVAYSPNSHDSTCPRSQLQRIKPDPISWIHDSHSPESFSNFFNLVFLTRLFWVCAFDAPSEIGSLYFHSLLAPNLEIFSFRHSPVMKTFFISVGADVELCFARTFGYMVAKHLILNELSQVGVGLKSLASSPTQNLGFSYAMESHGLWILKGYSPVYAMDCLWKNGQKNHYPMIEAKDAVLKYALAHQQLEVVIQLEYATEFHEGYIQVRARLDNIRIHVVKLGFKNTQGDIMDERHFPSRVRIWVGPELGSNYVSAVSLSRSTDNTEREVEAQKVMKGNFGKLKVPEVKATARMVTRTKVKNWRWDQDVEGNAAIFDAILCDNTSGTEIATWKPSVDNLKRQPADNFGKRYSGASRAFAKSGGVIFAGAECGGDGVGWRLSKEMEGSVLKWRIGGKVWLTYLPNDVNSGSYMETRSVQWCEEVDLPLIPGKYQ